MKIFIIGFMGTGKSHWGQRWAKAYGWQFADLDQLIEEKEGKTVAQLFEKKDEAYFRELEAATLRAFAGKDHCIVSCGGGTACHHDNMQWMNENGITVCLTAGANTILRRVLAEKDKRPLVKNLNEAELLFFIEQKLIEREPFYSQARFVLKEDAVDENSFALFTRKQ
jgi:shikimate kinase